MGDASAGIVLVTLPTAIEFLALTGYPESPQRRTKAEEAMRSYYLRCCRRAGTLDRLGGSILAPQQMENQFRGLKRRLAKRLAAANDCVLLHMGLSAPGSEKPLPRAEREDNLCWASENKIPKDRVLLTSTVPGRLLSSELLTYPLANLSAFAIIADAGDGKPHP
jgi:hypothetical protein